MHLYVYFIAVGIIGVLVGAISCHLYWLRRFPVWKVEYVGEYTDETDLKSGRGLATHDWTDGTILVRAITEAQAYAKGKKKVHNLNLGRSRSWYKPPRLTITLANEPA